MRIATFLSIALLVPVFVRATDYLPLSVSQLARETRDELPVRVTGTVVDVFPDDIDRRFVFLQLKDGNDRLSVSALATDLAAYGPSGLLNATVAVKGIFYQDLTGARLFLGPHVSLARTEDLEIVTPPTNDPYETPPLEPLGSVDPRVITARERGYVVGTVLAVRPGGRIVLQGSGIWRVNADLAEGVVPPVCGAFVRLVGRPTTDLYNLNLTHASWRTESGRPRRPEPPADVSLRQIVASDDSNGPYRPGCHGRLVRLSGLVKAVDTAADGFHRVRLLSDGLPLDVELPPDVTPPDVGATVAATGVWVFDVDNWRPDAILPRIRGYALVLRAPADLRVLARPSWWTPRRLWTLIGALGALLVAIFIWNGVLRRLIDRRGRELCRESLAHAKSELRIGERTRLAVELHDALSQTLAGVSFRIDAVEEAARRSRPDDVMKHLTTARLTLGSCREELRNCLWDLRNDALDEADAAEAIRRTLRPHLLGAALAVRFPVPRARLSDTTFHAILRIVRELVVNAVRHGQAHRISVAGALDETGLAFSVRDDGVGFDPDTCPDSETGHFGLQGIRERLEQLGGEMQIDSHPGQGAKITVRIPR